MERKRKTLEEKLQSAKELVDKIEKQQEKEVVKVLKSFFLDSLKDNTLLKIKLKKSSKNEEFKKAVIKFMEEYTIEEDSIKENKESSN
ncbi:hypothetical protein [Fusobacterium sp. FSA-380-WT-2B]|uniref:hypothetical protein n=1 Tax=Fusobacterium sp. FSA-380-WT-2B TaxID=2605786 RepID=UPI0012B328C6|nr:hypothetical protein [Fusobacterium sp. FSA-380-WT-2B]MSS62127.1 hypothetical protein [Fusobacterium sp. FSA-380-WT-2B]